MPHLHSAAALAARRQRAALRGFIVRRPDGHQHVLVHDDVADRVRCMARSIKLHHSHNVANGRPAHFARDAARAACGDGKDLGHAMRCHRAANQAKHCWHKDREAEDPLMVNDPWLHARRPSAIVAPCLDDDANHWANFQPSAHACCGRSSSACTACTSWALLADAQNQTIAALTAALKSLSDSSHGVAVADASMHTTAELLPEVATELPTMAAAVLPMGASPSCASASEPLLFAGVEQKDAVAASHGEAVCFNECSTANEEDVIVADGQVGPASVPDEEELNAMLAMLQTPIALPQPSVTFDSEDDVKVFCSDFFEMHSKETRTAIERLRQHLLQKDDGQECSKEVVQMGVARLKTLRCRLDDLENQLAAEILSDRKLVCQPASGQKKTKTKFKGVTKR